MNHDFKLEFVDSGLYFVQQENDLIYPFLQVGSGSDKKIPDPAGKKSTDPEPPNTTPCRVCQDIYIYIGMDIRSYLPDILGAILELLIIWLDIVSELLVLLDIQKI